MEPMEFERDPGLMLGMCACDADLFSRVWERVGAEERPDCPVEVVPAARPAHSAPRETVPAERAMPERMEHTAQRAVSAEEGVEERRTAARTDECAGDDFPEADDLPCLGSASATHGGQLQQYIREELEGWQLYRHLARRINGPHARTLAALASEKHRCARRLAAAHFLIAGMRYWPTDKLETPRLNSWLGVLRERFSVEQRHEHRYRAAACDTNDPCLAELYSELAGDCAAHAAVLRSVLEAAL